MRNFLILMMGLVMVSCQSKGDSSLKASVNNVKDGTPVYISTLERGNRTVPVDTVKVENGKIVVDLPNVDFQTLNILKIDGVRGNMLFINENKPLKATIYKDSLRKSRVTGGPANKLFLAYTNRLYKSNHELMDLHYKYTKEQLNDPKVKTTIRNTQERIMNENTVFRKKAIQEHPDLLPTLFIFSDMLRTQAVPLPEMKEMFKGLSSQLKETYIGRNINNQLEQASAVAIGSKAPQFSAKTPEGKELSLADAMGEKYTLVDFWASWCKPCRAENPNVVKVYKKYHDKGLAIIGVSLDKDKAKWKAAIKEDGLQWHQVSNLKFWQDPIAKMYNVRAIPANFLLDKDGKIVAKNLRGQALEIKMAELLGDK